MLPPDPPARAPTNSGSVAPRCARAPGSPQRTGPGPPAPLHWKASPGSPGHPPPWRAPGERGEVTWKSCDVSDMLFLSPSWLIGVAKFEAPNNLVKTHLTSWCESSSKLRRALVMDSSPQGEMMVLAWANAHRTVGSGS